MVKEYFAEYVGARLAAHQPPKVDLEQLARDLGPPLTDYITGQLAPFERELAELSGHTVAHHVWLPELVLKSFDAERREFDGVASSKSVDLEFDILEPQGAIFTTPLPLCWQHDIKNGVVGEVFWAQANSQNIEFRARIPPDAQIVTVIRSPSDEITAELSRLRERVTELESRRYDGVANAR